MFDVCQAAWTNTVLNAFPWPKLTCLVLSCPLLT